MELKPITKTDFLDSDGNYKKGIREKYYNAKPIEFELPYCDFCGYKVDNQELDLEQYWHCCNCGNNGKGHIGYKKALLLEDHNKIILNMLNSILSLNENLSKEQKYEVMFKQLNFYKNNILGLSRSQENTKGEKTSNKSFNADSPSSISNLDKSEKMQLLKETEPLTSYDREDDEK